MTLPSWCSRILLSLLCCLQLLDILHHCAVCSNGAAVEPARGLLQLVFQGAVASWQCETSAASVRQLVARLAAAGKFHAAKRHHLLSLLHFSATAVRIYSAAGWLPAAAVPLVPDVLRLLPELACRSAARVMQAVVDLAGDAATEEDRLPVFLRAMCEVVRLNLATAGAFYRTFWRPPPVPSLPSPPQP